ncbi:MAG: ABC transporter substrate-binding protein [Methylococcaceae bacterium]
MKRLKGLIFLLGALLTMSWTSPIQAAEIVIGFTGPLSGPTADYGQDCVTGLDMAIKELNAAGGITVDGQKLLFKLEKLDDKLEPNQAISNSRQLLAKNALAIYNPVFGTQAALMKINQEDCSEFILMGFTSNPKATRTDNKLLVTMNTPLGVYAQIFADMAWERGWRKAAMVVTIGTYGDEWREVFKTSWKKLGGTLTADKPANYSNKTEFSAPLAAALATKPDVILIGGPSDITALVIEQSRGMGYKGGFLLVDQAKIDYIAQKLEGTRLMENVIGVAGFAGSPAPAAAAFDKKYRANYKRLTTWEAVSHYNSVFALSKAIQVANTVDDVYAIRNAFPKAFPMLGDRFASEDHGISPAGRLYSLAGVQSIKNGKFTQPDMYVWWTKTPAEFDKVKKATKYKASVKLFKPNMVIIE